jgi:tetratricopeptide (TPR) repeat protein
MSILFDRASALLEQFRPDLAETELVRGLAFDPGDAHARALLALCLLERDDTDAAAAEAARAIQLEPDLDVAHFALACALQKRGRTAEALPAIIDAVRLQPCNPRWLAKLAEIQYEQGDWRRALEAAELGLETDAGNAACADVRARVLEKLAGPQATMAADAVLPFDAQDPYALVDRGFELLGDGRPREALEDFGAALRLEPNLPLARTGIEKALQARYLIFRLLLPYLRWVENLKPAVRAALVVGGWFGNQGLRWLEGVFPPIEPWVHPLIVLYMDFVIMSWLGAPLADLLLETNKFGRLSLPRDRRRAAICIGLSLLAAMVLAIWWLVTGETIVALGALVFGFLCLPIAGTLHCPEGWRRRVMSIYTQLLALLGIGGFVLLFLALHMKGGLKSDLALLAGFAGLVLFGVGVVVSTFLSNVLIAVRRGR